MTVDPVSALLSFGALLLLLPLLFWPYQGLVPRLTRLARLDERVHVEDALKHVYTCQRAGLSCSLDSLAGRLEVAPGHAATLLSRLTARGLVRRAPDGLRLTADGERSAVQIVRTHRLWERYLADRTGVPATEWHDRAERMEHALSVEEVDTLDSRLGHPPWDPHGDPIPTAGGLMPAASGLELVAAEPGRTVEVVHLEDEPREIYDSLLGDGLTLGARLEIVDRDDLGVRVRAAGREWTLDPVRAANVTVRTLPVGERPDGTGTTLAEVPVGETARVLGIARSCQGTQRRRLLDLGVVRGAEVRAELRSASGDPVAYRVRGALIALRRGQAREILVDRSAGGSSAPPDPARADGARAREVA